jgi:methionyl-tRNA synthetase
MIGKDIVRFHAVYWPAFLMSAGLELPAKVFAHGFLLVKGEKMSKSIGNVVDPFALIEALRARPGALFLHARSAVRTGRQLQPESIATRINSDLANGIGNLASRSLSMINKNCDGKMPACGALTDEDKALLNTVDKVIETARADMANFQIHKALAAIIDVVADGDRYFASQEPWALKKTDPARMETVLYVTAETVRQISILLQPFMPESAANCWICSPHSNRQA